MEGYRETRALDRPAAFVRAALDDDARFHADAADAETPSRWTARRWPYRTVATLDATAGDLHVAVSLPDAYRPLGVGLLLAVLAGLGLDVAARAFLPALWVGAGLTLLPVGHLLVGPLPDVPGLRTVDRGLAAATLAPYAATALALFGALRAVLPVTAAAAPTAVLATVGVGAYLLAGTGRRVTALDVPLSGLLAPLVAATNVLVAVALLQDPTSPGLAVALVGTLALLLTALFLAYCRLALDRFRAARPAPVPRRYRALAAVGYAGLTVLLAGSVGLALRTVVAGGSLPFVGRGLQVPAFPFGAGPAADFAAVGFYALLVAPLAWLAVAWIGHLGTSVVGRGIALARSEPLPAPTRDEGESDDDTDAAPFPVPVRVVPTDRPFVRPVAVAGLWRGVLVGRPVVDALAADELRAVVAHETHHLDGRDLTAGAVATLAGLGFGGRNALLAFYDYAAAERAADEHAARTVGPDALVRALRRLEGLQARGVDRPVTDGGVAAGRTAVHVRTWRLLRAPYDLFFGRVLLDAAHRSVDERIRYIWNSSGNV
jgi:Zn-dependent protease with chaperone function